MTGRPCIFGEVLFDVFPDGTRVLGGAPFNVAWHLQAFGCQPRFISRVGNDPEGKAIRNAMTGWGIDTSDLQIDRQRPTGQVTVRFVDGQPTYDIAHPCAYDAIEPARTDAGGGLLYHGSLALRDPVTRQSAESMMASGSPTIFVDVNLRPPWWHKEHVLDMVHRADWVKLNQDELEHLTGSTSSAERFLHEHQLQGLILTRGSSGSELLTARGARLTVTPKGRTKVVDTVGAGDALTSVIILGLHEDWPLETTLVRAQEFASAVVGQQGATVTDAGFYRRLINTWNR